MNTRIDITPDWDLAARGGYFRGDMRGDAMFIPGSAGGIPRLIPGMPQRRQRFSETGAGLLVGPCFFAPKASVSRVHDPMETTDRSVQEFLA